MSIPSHFVVMSLVRKQYKKLVLAKVGDALKLGK